MGQIIVLRKAMLRLSWRVCWCKPPFMRARREKKTKHKISAITRPTTPGHHSPGSLLPGTKGSDIDFI